jgi:hypothetical protein
MPFNLSFKLWSIMPGNKKLLNKESTMYKSFIAICLISTLLSCNAQSSQKGKNNTTAKKSTTNMAEGKDYIILKRFRLTDNQGFNQPVEAVSFLLPANWTVNGAIQWNITSKCIPEMVQASFQAASPDNDYELMVFPVTQFDWSNDAVQLDAMQRGFYTQSCHIAAPLDAAGYIRNGLAPLVKAQVTSSKIIDVLQQQMDAGAQQMTMQARQAGNNAYSHKGSAAEGLLQFSDGKKGLAFCTVMQTILTMPGTQGGMANNFQCYVSMRIVLKYAAGNEAMARKIMGTFFSGARINPQWMKGVQGFFAAVTSNAQNQLWKQIQISHGAQEEIGNNIIRSWENKSSSINSSPTDNEGFSQYIRGVDNWADADGNKVELTSGYSNAWSKDDGSYLLSNNPAFDPNVELGGTQNWNRMKQ